MVLIHDRIIIIDICNFEMSYKTLEKSLKSNQIYSVASLKCFWIEAAEDTGLLLTQILSTAFDVDLACTVTQH